jgi:predicted RNA-binding protein (virulence factor B family)
MIKLGEVNNLLVNRGSAMGFFLIDTSGEEVFLPFKYAPDNLQLKDVIDVFVYNDSEDKIIATTQTPKITINTFAALKVVDAASFGAFMDWGLDKDLLVPFKEQATKMYDHKTYVVYLFLDETSDRLVATTKLNRYLDNTDCDLKANQEVDLLVFEDFDLGYFAIINNKYKGLIYKNEIYSPIKVGDSLKGYVKQIKEGNLIDLSLQKIGFENIDINSQLILDYLKKHNGVIALHDNSDPDDIRRLLGMSKKTFKKAIGILYRQKLVKIEATQTVLV